MNLIIRQATVSDRQSPFHNRTCDVLVQNGIIKKIADKISEADATVIDAAHCSLTPGFFDLHVNFCEPGYEYKEDIQTGCNAAMAGGFTGVLQMPGTFPVIQNKAGVEQVTGNKNSPLVELRTSGALSAGMEGKDLTEMFDMYQSGALCFTDDKHPVQDAGLMLRALLYARNFNGLIMSFPDDRSVSGKGQMNEGIESTSLGLKGIPSIAEELMVARDLNLCVYTESRIHFSTLSTAGSVALIRQAKAKGIQVTCDVAAHHLLLNDSFLRDFDSRFKMKPPLRTEADVQALRAGLADGTIDAICSDHTPEDTENKQKEFGLAAFGAEGLETAFSAAFTAMKGMMKTDELLEKFSASPRKILSLAPVRIAEGEKANFTLVDLSQEWTVQESDLRSKSKNNPFVGMKLAGKVIAVVNNGRVNRN